MQNKKDEARAILEKIYPAHEVEDEMKALEISIEAEKADTQFLGAGIFSKVKSAWSNTVVRRGLYAGITVQVAQQFVGINTVMYYSPTIVQLAGFASNKTALALSLITSGLNAVGSIVSMCFVDRFGRRRLMIVSMFGIIACLVVLSVLFMQASSHAPPISAFESNHFGSNSTCSAFLKAPDALSWNCMSCLQSSSDCAFCSNGNNKVSFVGFTSSLMHLLTNSLWYYCQILVMFVQNSTVVCILVTETPYTLRCYPTLLC